MFTKRITSEKGVTLAEVMISMAIVGISIFSMLLLFPKMKVMVDVSHHKVEATRACQQKLENFRRAGFSGVPSGTTQEIVTLDSGENLVSAVDDLRAILTTTVTNINSGGLTIAKKVLVQCQWNEHRSVVNEYLDFVLYRNIA